MRGFDLSSSGSRKRFGGVGAAWWLTRWALVLLLAFDQFSSPLHAHEHDGAAGHLAFVTAHDTIDAGEAHAHQGSHALPSHPLMAVRAESSRSDPPARNGDADPHAAPIATFGVLAAVEPPAASHWRPGRTRPDMRSHRSLPPAGRAPPFHA